MARERTLARARPGYLFAASTIALAVVLYFEYVSFVVLKAVCVLCLTMAAAVVGLFFLSGSTTPFPMTTLPRRAARDLRDLFTSPVAVVVALLFLGGAASALAWFPREGVGGDERHPGGCRQQPGQTPRGARPRRPQAQASEFERYWDARERVALADSRRRREGADRQVQRLPVSAVPEFAHGLQADCWTNFISRNTLARCATS